MMDLTQAFNYHKEHCEHCYSGIDKEFCYAWHHLQEILKNLNVK